MARKLVRDRIPEIIRNRGIHPIIRHATDDREYALLLRAKLLEEVAAYLTAGAITNLCDVHEVVVALAQLDGFTAAALERAAEGRAASRGRFDDRIVWLGNSA